MDIKTKWVKTLIGDDSINVAAQKAGTYQATLSRQIAARKITTDMVIALARGYEMSPITALLETGILTEDDIALYRAELSLTEATDQQLVDEVARRIAGANTDNEIYHQPITIQADQDYEPPLNLAAHDPGDDYVEESDHLYD